MGSHSKQQLKNVLAHGSCDWGVQPWAAGGSLLIGLEMLGAEPSLGYCPECHCGLSWLLMPIVLSCFTLTGSSGPSMLCK